MKAKTDNLYTNAYISEAAKLGISHKILLKKGLILLYTTNHQYLFYKAVPQINGAVTSLICRNKTLTIELLQKKDLPCTNQSIINNLDQIKQLLQHLPLPLVIKPIRGIAGRDVYTNINSKKEVERIAGKLLLKYSELILENHVPGEDHRFLVLDNQVIGVLRRDIPTITGDGVLNIKSLILNHPKSNRIGLEDQVISTLKNQDCTLDTILAKNKVIRVRSNANQSTGGTVAGFNNKDVHPKLLKLAIQASHAVHARLTGIDILIQDLAQPPKNNATIIEVNHNPCFIMHQNPDHGPSQITTSTILKKIFELNG